MIKKILFFLTILLLYSCSQNRRNISAEWNKKKTDSLYFSAYDPSKNLVQRKAAIEKLYKHYSIRKNDSTKRRNFFKIANRYRAVGDHANFLDMTNQVMSLAKKAEDSNSVGRAYFYYGLYYFNLAQNDSTFFYFHKAEKIFRSTKNLQYIATIQVNKASLLKTINEISSAEMLVTSALTIAKEIKDPFLVYRCNYLIGDFRYLLKDYEKAIEYHRNAMEVIKDVDEHFRNEFKIASISRLGTVYGAAGNLIKSLDFYDRAFKEPGLQDHFPALYADVIEGRSITNYKLNNVDPLTELKKALDIRQKIGSKMESMMLKLKIAEYFIDEEKFSLARPHIVSAFKESKKLKNSLIKLQVLRLMGKMDRQNSSLHYDKYIQLKDSLQTEERKEKNQYALIAYETADILHQKELMEVENEKLQLRSWTILGFGSFTILSGIFLFIFRTQKLKNRELQLKTDQQKDQEEIFRLMLEQQEKIEEGKLLEKNRISKELHDGVMGRLSGIRLNLYVLNKKNDSATIKKCITYVDKIQEVEKEIRAISHNLNNEIFGNTINFVSVIEHLLQPVRDHSDINFLKDVDQGIKWNLIHGNIKVQVYRIVQESLQNISKYSKASEVSLKMEKIDNNLNIEIIDNGIGFDTCKRSTGIGFKNMRQRANSINGNLTIASEIGTGTKIHLIIPL
ncbi:MAG TPA: ATP-binding protein [Salinimicrobium sp.]|nr:ATP-binding protein [Salinimicrobium sp.]